MFLTLFLLCTETQAEGLAPSGRLHPRPVDPHPARLLQNLRHQTPQAHLLNAVRASVRNSHFHAEVFDSSRALKRPHASFFSSSKKAL